MLQPKRSTKDDRDPLKKGHKITITLTIIITFHLYNYYKEFRQVVLSNIEWGKGSVCGPTTYDSDCGHYPDIHDKEIVRVATCVDEDNGIFLLQNSSRGCVGYPEHV